MILYLLLWVYSCVFFKKNITFNTMFLTSAEAAAASTRRPLNCVNIHQHLKQFQTNYRTITNASNLLISGLLPTPLYGVL
jgi:hypothetical protein